MLKLKGFSPKLSEKKLLNNLNFFRHKLLVVCVTLALSDEEDRVSDKTRLMELTDFWFDLKAVPRGEKQSVSSQQRHHGIFTVSKLPNLKTLK